MPRLQDGEKFSYDPYRKKMWTVQIRDQTARSAQSDLDLHSPQKLLVSSWVRKELNVI